MKINAFMYLFPSELLNEIEIIIPDDPSTDGSRWVINDFIKNIKEKILKRDGDCKVVLKRLENVEDANRSWLDEASSSLISLS